MSSAGRHLQVVKSPADELTNRALMAGVARRDPAALSAFFGRFEHLVNRIVWRILGADANHDDVASVALETMVNRVGDVQQPSALEVWVRTVSVNAARMELRRRRWRRFFTRSLDDTNALTYPDLSVPDEATRERVRGLYRALDTLDVDGRTMIVLRHLEGLELTEVADAMACSLATLKRRLSRAEERLAAILGAPLREGAP